MEYREASRSPHEGTIEFISLDSHKGAGESLFLYCPLLVELIMISLSRVALQCLYIRLNLITTWRLSVCFHSSSVSTQRPAVSGLLHAALAHWYAAVGWPHSPGPGSHTEKEVREL